MARRLNTTIHVYDENGDPVVFVPGDVVPKKFRDQVTAQGIWQDDDEGAGSDEAQDNSSGQSNQEEGTGSGDQNPGGAGDSGQSGSSGQQSENTGSSDSTSLVKPPVVGTGSGTAPWLAYAKGLGLTVADDANKADLIEAVNAHEASKGQDA